MKIIQSPSPNFAVGRKGYKPEVIVLHITVGTANSCISWFATTQSQVSSHYMVGEDGEVYQFVAEEDTAWANGRVDKPTFKLYKQGVNPNLYSISIENAGMDLSMAGEKQIDSLVKLVKSVATRWNIPIDRDHIIGHYQIFAGKPNCPATNKDIIDRVIRQANEKPSGLNKEEVLKQIEILKELVVKL